jgi:hypothetical protein
MGNSSNSAVNANNGNQIVYPSTIPKNIVPAIDNVVRFAAYTDLEQQMFYALRQGFLVMMPYVDADNKTYELIAIQQAELIAFTIVDSWPTALKIIQVEDDGTVNNSTSNILTTKTNN